jgi:aryl sulfotransferase
LRDDDIIIASYAKSGTTWTQQIVGQMIFDGEDIDNLGERSPWVDMRLDRDAAVANLTAQTHRRFLKTHLPTDALPWSPDIRYIYLARDGRDVAWSMHWHFVREPDRFFDEINAISDRVGPRFERPANSEREFYLDWLKHDGQPMPGYWDNIRTWWAVRNLPNVRLIHFSDLKADLPGEIVKLAAFLDIGLTRDLKEKILKHASLEHMRGRVDAVLVNKGTNGRWRDTLSDEEAQAWESRALSELGSDCAHWLVTGKMT